MKRMKILTYALCAWMVIASPAAVLAEEDVQVENAANPAAASPESPAEAATEAVGTTEAAGTAEAAGTTEAAGTAEAAEATETAEATKPTETAAEVTAATEHASEAGAEETPPPTDADIPDEDRNPQLTGDTPIIEEYELFRPESSNNTLDTLYKGRSARLVITIQSSTLQTGDIKASEILVSRERDSYRTTGSPVVKIASKKGERLVYKIIFPKITYNGKNTEFAFRVKYKGSGIEPTPLSVDITEAEESSYSNRGERDEEEATAQPLVRVERVGNPQPMGAGERAELTLRLVNTSKSADVEDLQVSFTPGGSMYLMDDTNSQLIKRLNTGKSTEIKVNLQAGQDLSGASQSLDVELKFNYYSANRLTAGTTAQKVMIPIKGNSATGQPLIRISRVSGGSAVRAGEPFQTVIRIENTSQNKDISGLTATWEPTEQISLMDATDTNLLGDLKAGQSLDIPVHLKASAELSPAASQLIGISLKFDYDSGKGAAQGTLNGKIVIPTAGGIQTIGSPTPNIIIRNYSYGGIVEAGQVFDLVMELVNTSSTAPVENVLMSLDTGEGISINDSSNTIYIPSLAPGAVTTKTVKMQALFQSKLQSPKIGISFKYEYLDKKERKQNTTNEAIAIPVYQPDRLEIRTPGFTETIRQNEETAISIPYANKGRGQIFNVEAKLDGEIDVLERQLTLGNFESGKNGTIDFVVTPRTEGKFNGTVLIAYEDEAQKRKELTVPIAFDVQAPELTTEPEAESQTPVKKNGKPFWILAAAGLVIAVGAGRTIRKKRNKRKAQNRIADNSCEAWEDAAVTTEPPAEPPTENEVPAHEE